MNNLNTIINSIINLNEKEYIKLSKNIEYIILNQIIDEKILSDTFDSLLSLVFIDDKRVESLFYKLIQYTSNFNKELSDDYESIFLEQFKDNELDYLMIKKLENNKKQ